MKTSIIMACIAATLITSCATNTVTSGIKPYPLKVCIVTDNDINSMGDAQAFNYKGQQLKVCCEACIEEFNKNPAKYLSKLPK